MKYNIAIIPPKNVCDNSILLSEIVVKNGGVFSLGDKINFPHISVAQFKCDDDNNLNNIVKDVFNVTRKTNSFKITQDKYHAYKDEWIFVSFLLNESLQELENKFINVLDDNCCKKTSRDFSEFPAHITFSRIINNNNFNVNSLPKKKFSFVINEIGIFECDDNDGTSKKLLKSFKLL